MRRIDLWLSSALLVAAGCDEASAPSDGGAGTSGEIGEVRIQFRAMVGAKPFACGGTYDDVGADGFELTLDDARMFVHDLELLREGGGAVPVVMTPDDVFQRENLALIDFEDATSTCRFGTPEMHTTVVGEAEAGSYTGIRFKLGVPFDENHQDQALAEPPLNLTSMFWSWNGGYKFLRVDGDAGEAGPLSFHLGSTGCQPDDTGLGVSKCDHPNRPTIEISGFDPTEQAVALDIARLLADTRSGSAQCLSQPDSEECEGPFSHLGVGGGDADAFRSAKRVAEPDAGMPMSDEAGVSGCEDLVPDEAFVWDLPEGFPEPLVPEGNPMSDAKVELGRRLFYDTQLSLNETQSCSSCHEQDKSFTDGLAGSVGSTGEVNRRSSMSLANVGYYARFTWANPLLDTLEEQALIPLLGEAPVELGWAGKEDELLARLEADADYPAMFEEAFGTDCRPVSLDHITKALGAFQRTLFSGASPYDAYWYGGDRQALSEDALVGLQLFNSERLECFHCHGGVNFSGNNHIDAAVDEPLFANNGLYDLDGEGAYPKVDQGTLEVTGHAIDMGAFKPPSLRNITLTAPYMHDGSLATLDDVIDHYAAGGAGSPLANDFLVGFELTGAERRQLKAFLESLTDKAFLEDTRFASPF